MVEHGFTETLIYVCVYYGAFYEAVKGERCAEWLASICFSQIHDFLLHTVIWLCEISRLRRQRAPLAVTESGLTKLSSYVTPSCAFTIAASFFWWLTSSWRKEDAGIFGQWRALSELDFLLDILNQGKIVSKKEKTDASTFENGFIFFATVWRISFYRNWCAIHIL